jgi:hypothetical protein
VTKSSERPKVGLAKSKARAVAPGSSVKVQAAIDEAALLGDLRTLVQSARQRIATAAYSTQTLLCWHIGRRLDREHLQGGRAAYGKQILVTVSRELTAEYGRGFSYAEIARMIQFAQAYPEEAIVVTLSQQLSWSHFHALLPIKDPLARDFYAETDPNKLHDLKAALDGAQVYSPDQVQQFAALFLAGAERDQLDPILDACVAAYTGTLDEDQQVDFKGKAKVFCRTYDFLASVMPGTNPEWEKLSILLNLLVSKLPAPEEEDLAKGILEAIDMDSYRVEKKALMKIALADADAEIAPVPTDGGGRKPEPELDRLSNILKTFNDNFGTLFDDTDRVAKRIRDDIAPKVAADKAFQNARENTPHTARMAHDQALGKVMQILLKDDTQVYKQFVENESFRRFVGDMVYQLTSQ